MTLRRGENSTLPRAIERLDTASLFRRRNFLFMRLGRSNPAACDGGQKSRALEETAARRAVRSVITHGVPSISAFMSSST